MKPFSKPITHSYLDFQHQLRNRERIEYLPAKNAHDRNRQLAYFASRGEPFKSLGFTTGVIIKDEVYDEYYTFVISDRYLEKAGTYLYAKTYCASANDGPWVLPDSLTWSTILASLSPDKNPSFMLSEHFHKHGSQFLSQKPDFYWYEPTEKTSLLKRLGRAVRRLFSHDIRRVRAVKILCLTIKG